MAQTVKKDRFVKSLRDFARTVDRTVRELEVSTSCPSIMRPKSEFAAPAAEDLLEELQGMNAEVGEIGGSIQEKVDELDSFLDATMKQFQDVYASLRAKEEAAAKFGYQPEAEVDLESWREEPEEEEECEEKDDDDDDEEEIEEPNIFEMGLSKHTLNAMGYKFKEPKAAEEEVSIDHLSAEEESPVQSILKKPTVDMSMVEISPGLVVRRPSTKSLISLPRPVLSNGSPAAPEFQTGTPNKSTAKTSSSSDDLVSPEAPVLQTVNLTRYLASKSSHNAPPQVLSPPDAPALSPFAKEKPMTAPIAPALTPISKKMSLSDLESPEMPELKTVNLTKYLSKQASEKDNEPSSVQASSPSCMKKPVALSPISKKMPPPSDLESPEMPKLKTVNLSKQASRSEVKAAPPSIPRPTAEAKENQHQPKKDIDEILQSPAMPVLSVYNRLQ